MIKKITVIISILMILLQPTVMGQDWDNFDESWLETGEGEYISDEGGILTDDSPDGEYNAAGGYVIFESPDFEGFPWGIAGKGNFEIDAGEIFVDGSASIRLSGISEESSPIPEVIGINGEKVGVYFDVNPADPDKAYIRFRPDGDVEVNAPLGQKVEITFENGITRRVVPSGGGDVKIVGPNDFVAKFESEGQDQQGQQNVKISPKGLENGLRITSSDDRIEMSSSTSQDGTKVTYVVKSEEGCSGTGAVIFPTGYMGGASCVILVGGTVAVVGIVLNEALKTKQSLSGELPKNLNPSQIQNLPSIAEGQLVAPNVPDGSISIESVRKAYSGVIHQKSDIQGDADPESIKMALERTINPYLAMRNFAQNFKIDGQDQSSSDQKLSPNVLSRAGNEVVIKTWNVENGPKIALAEAVFRDLTMMSSDSGKTAFKEGEVLQKYIDGTKKSLNFETAAKMLATDIAEMVSTNGKIEKETPTYNAVCKPIYRFSLDYKKGPFVNPNSGYC